MVRRRELLFAIAVVALDRPPEVQAQPTSRPLIVIVSGGPPLPGNQDAFLRTMRAAGLEQDRDFDFAFKSTEGDPAQRSTLAKQVVALSPAIILSTDTPLTME